MPPELASGGLVTAVAAGLKHGLALLANGSVLGWDNTPSARLLPFPDGRIATLVAAGFDSSYVVLDNGSLLAWITEIPFDGNTSTWATMAVPQQGARVASVAGGDHFTVVALSSGTIAGFGSNSYGQLSFHPELLQPGAGVAQVAAGSKHTVALTSDGRVHAFGSNYFNQCSVPASVQELRARKVGASGDASYALLGDGDVSSGGQLLAWGAVSPVLRAALQGLTNVVDFAAGSGHVAVRLATGEATAFGYNRFGQVRAGWWKISKLSETVSQGRCGPESGGIPFRWQ
jgi:alpha-tubulin suppressor-like RCC1 family protein